MIRKNYLFFILVFFFFTPLFSMNQEKIHKKNKNIVQVTMNVVCLLNIDPELRKELGLEVFNSQSDVYARIEADIQCPRNINFSVPTFLPYGLLKDKQEGSEITLYVTDHDQSKIVTYHCSEKNNCGKNFEQRLDELCENFKEIYHLNPHELENN